MPYVNSRFVALGNLVLVKVLVLFRFDIERTPNRHDFIIALEHAEKLRAAAALNPKLVQQDDGRPAEPAAAAGDNEHSLRLVRVPGAAG